MSVQARSHLSVEEYLDLERRAEVRSEYLGGEMFAMAGASLAHNEIVGNLYASLRRQLRRRGCVVWATDFRIRIEATGLHTYPDVVVVCDPPRLVDDAGQDTLLNPQLIVEVLSPSTENWDRGGKFGHYRTVASLTDYLLVSQDRILVEHFARQRDDRWLLTAVSSLDAVIEASLDAKLALEDVYERVPGLAAAAPAPRGVGLMAALDKRPNSPQLSI